MRLSNSTTVDIRRGRRYIGRGGRRTITKDKLAARRVSRRKLDEYVRNFSGDWDDFNLPTPPPFNLWDVI